MSKIRYISYGTSTSGLCSWISCARMSLEAKKKFGDAIEAVHPEYYQQGDPTIMVRGVKSGWAHDFLDEVKVRLDSQTVQASANALSIIDLSGLQNKSIPPDVWDVMVKLLGEFCSLGGNDEKSTAVNQVPLCHDTGVEDTNRDTDAEAPLWRDRWKNRQPWFPLFVEWEAEYVHVPWENWTLQKSVSGILWARTHKLPHRSNQGPHQYQGQTPCVGQDPDTSITLFSAECTYTAVV